MQSSTPPTGCSPSRERRSRDGGVAVSDGRIAAVGPADELEGEVRRFADAAIVPGFVNAHTHLEYAVYAGFGDGLAFGPWLHTHIERKARIGWDEFLAIARLGAAECLASGVTTIGDASFSGAAARRRGRPGPAGDRLPGDLRRRSGQASRSCADVSTSSTGAVDGRVALGVSPHAPYSVSADVYAAAYDLGRPIATHVAESDDERDYMLRGEGPIAAVSDVEPPRTTSVRHLAAHGLLAPGVVAAHCVKVDAEEIELLARHEVAVVHCPRSNAHARLRRRARPRAPRRRRAASAWEPTARPRRRRSTCSRRCAPRSTQRARAPSDPDALSASGVLELATLGSARALGLADETGSLAAGKRADLAVVSLAGSPYLPWEDPTVAVVFGGSPDRVLLTLVAGEERYEKGGFRWHELRRSAAAARARMLATEAPPAPKT